MGFVVSSWFALGSVSEGGRCYFASSLEIPEEMREPNSKRTSGT